MDNNDGLIFLGLGAAALYLFTRKKAAPVEVSAPPPAIPIQPAQQAPMQGQYPVQQQAQYQEPQYRPTTQNPGGVNIEPLPAGGMDGLSIEDLANAEPLYSS